MSNTSERRTLSISSLAKEFKDEFIKIDLKNNLFCDLCKIEISGYRYYLKRHCDSSKHISAKNDNQRLSKRTSTDLSSNGSNLNTNSTFGMFDCSDRLDLDPVDQIFGISFDVNDSRRDENTFGQNSSKDLNQNYLSSTNFQELKGETEQFHFDLINLLIILKVSFLAFDNPIFIDFMKKYCKNNLGYTLKKSSSMRKIIDKVYDLKKRKLIDELSDRKINLIVDESYDPRRKSMLNILVCYFDLVKNKTISNLLNSFEITVCNSESVKDCVLECIDSYKLKKELIIGFITENAAYMKKCYSLLTLDKGLKNMVHVTCYSHILHLISREIFGNLPALEQLLVMTKRYL